MSRPKLLFVKRWKWISPDKCIFCVYTTYTHEWKMESLTPRKRKSIRPCQQIRESTSREEIADLSRDKKLRHVRIGIGRGGGEPARFVTPDLSYRGRGGRARIIPVDLRSKTKQKILGKYIQRTWSYTTRGTLRDDQTALAMFHVDYYLGITLTGIYDVCRGWVSCTST